MAPQLTRAERDRLAQFHQAGQGPTDIGRALNRAASTISRELRRNSTGGEYLPAQAQERAERRRRERPVRRKMDRPEIGDFVCTALEQYCSPEQIAGQLHRQHPGEPQRQVSAQTIYAWIAAQGPEDRRSWRGFLRRRGRRPRRRKTPSESRAATRIADRPAVIEQRQRLGDFEGDTVLGPPGTGGLVSLVDRRSRFTLLAKVQSKQASYVARRIRRRLERLPPEKRRSVTLDNGREFARVRQLEQHLGLSVYFAEPGRPYQRGTNENTNGLIRQFFPKGTDFRFVSRYEVQRVEDLLNQRPRACLGYRTPEHIFLGPTTAPRCDSS